MKPKYMSRRVLISGGGTGGHIYPAISIANEFKKRNEEYQILFVGAKGRMEMKKVPKNGYKIKGIWITGINRKNIFSNILFPFKLIISLIQSFFIVIKFNPDIAIGTGGFASGPALIISHFFNKPILLQEQNSFPGITNKILSKYAKKIFVAYENMDKFFPENKILNFGNPIRNRLFNIKSKDIEAFKKNYEIKNNKTILFLGGSLGAKVMNDYVFNNENYFIENNYQVILQCGERYRENYLNKSTSLIKVIPFIDDMHLAFSCSDLIVSRSGAIIISELSNLGKPVIFIPSPNVAEDHQTKNAKYLYEIEAAELVHEDEIDYKLNSIIKKIFVDEKLKEKYSKNLKKISNNNSTELIVDQIENYIV